jgi:hypothetical protein
MTTMDHGAAHERIEDLILEPVRLDALAGSSEPADVALREHLAGCPICRADLDGWEEVRRRITGAIPRTADEATAAVEPIELPPSLRTGVLAAVRAPGDEAAPAPVPTLVRAGRARRPSGRTLAGWLGLAASIAVLAGAGVVAVDQASLRDSAQAEARALSSALAAVDRVLGAPEHRSVELRNPAGAAAGSISWSSNDLVVITTTLAPPQAGQEYLCWLREPGSSAVVGKMYFAGRTAYWIGSLDEWATFRIGPDTRFAVTLSPIGGGSASDPEVLSAALGS